MKPHDIVHKILKNKLREKQNEFGCAVAPVNIALAKYWGKRDVSLNLPVTSSLSVSLGEKFAFTRISEIDAKQDKLTINNKTHTAPDKYLDLLRPNPKIHYQITSTTNIPIAAGLASSACGYAALIKAINNLYDWQLTNTELSILARFGSGSACRSMWPGFVAWLAGEQADGMDSYAIPLPNIWPSLRIGLLIINTATKPISSREAMQQTVATSKLYATWPETVGQDFMQLRQAIATQDFTLFGQTAESNAVAMHATMQAAKPPINYSQTATIAAIKKIHELRQQGMPLYFTQDAGPNLKLLFPANITTEVLEHFPDIEIMAPFANPNIDQVILVDKNDKAIGVEEKLAAHQQALLHRAFSVFIFRGQGKNLELLLQQRQQDKYHCGSMWTNTCCSHPKPGEDIISAANRRLQEEMGFTTCLQPVGNFHYQAQVGDLTEHELDHVLIGTTSQQKFNFNPEEVQDYQWIKIDELKHDLKQNPDKYTPWFNNALKVALKNIV